MPRLPPRPTRQCQNYSYNKDKIVDGAIITANQTTFYYATLAE